MIETVYPKDSAPVARSQVQPHSLVRTLALGLTQGLETPEARAATLFRFVRDNILYGFTPAFDAATPEETLRWGRGHCNPQSALFIAMLGAVGIRARAHFVAIDGRILDGIFPAMGPSRISHSFTEVKLGGRWLPVDAYCVDPRLYVGGRRRLVELDQPMGFGVHADGTHQWDGHRTAMVQLADLAMMLEDFGTFDEPSEFYLEPGYGNRMSTVEARLYRWFGAASANYRLDALREAAAPPHPFGATSSLIPTGDGYPDARAAA